MDYQKLSEIWGNVQGLMGVAGPHYMEVVQQAIQDVGMEGLRLGLLLHVLQFEPTPITAIELQKRVPYYATKPFEEGFQKLAAHEFIESDRNGYTLSEKGRQALSTIFGAAEEKLAELEQSIPPDIPQPLHNLLERLNDAAATSQEIAEKLCFKMQILRVSSKGKSILSEIEDLVSNLYSFRCDVHRHTWQTLDYALDGPTWEALTAIWRGEANSVATITENRLNARPTRGFEEAVYARSVEVLVGYGWIEADDGQNEIYRLTAMGNQVRQTSEDETNRLFYSVWSVLTESELETLKRLTMQLVEHLTQPSTTG